MKRTITAGLIAVFLAASMIAQTKKTPKLTNVTIYSSIKYQLPKTPSHRFRPNYSRAFFSFSKSGFLPMMAPWDINYGSLYAGSELDWFLVGPGRTVIKDLGAWTWKDSVGLQALEPLKVGEVRTLNVNTGGDRGRDGAPGTDGIRGQDGRSGADGADGGTGNHTENSAEPNTRQEPAPEPATPAKAGLVPDNPNIVKAPKTAIEPAVSQPIVTKALLGHMYQVHVVRDGADGADFYVLFRVDGLVSGDNCTISWRRVTAPQKN